MAARTITERANEGNIRAREDTRSNERYIRHAVNIIETEEDLTLATHIPGAARESLDVNVEKGILTISAALANG